MSESGGLWSAGLRTGAVRTIFISALGAAAGLAVVAVVVGFVFGYALVGLGVAAGLILGAVNAIGMRHMAFAVANAGGAKRPAAMSSMRRLAFITLVVVALLLLKRDLGLGAIVGVGVFQFALIVSSSRVMLQALRDGGRN